MEVFRFESDFRLFHFDNSIKLLEKVIVLFQTFSFNLTYIPDEIYSCHYYIFILAFIQCYLSENKKIRALFLNVIYNLGAS